MPPVPAEPMDVSRSKCSTFIGILIYSMADVFSPPPKRNIGLIHTLDPLNLTDRPEGAADAAISARKRQIGAKEIIMTITVSEA